MGVKRALMVGVCYKDNPDIELFGCWNDVEKMRDRLMSRFGFPEENIVLLADKPGTSPQLLPTGENIREKLDDLIRGLNHGDNIVFHYSGHGTQLPPEGEPDETGMKEAICPMDLNFITDDDFRILVNKIPDGVVFTFIADCCNSGGLIAHCEQQVGSAFTKPNALLTSLGPQLQEDDEEMEIVIPEAVLIQLLASMMGSVPSVQEPSMSLVEILAVMEVANSANMEMSIQNLLELYVASQEHKISMSEVLEAIVVGLAAALAESVPEPEQENMKKLFSNSTRDVREDMQLKKSRIQHMLESTKAHNIQRLLKLSHAKKPISRALNSSQHVNGGGPYPPPEHNHPYYNNSESSAPHSHYGYPPTDAGKYYSIGSQASWQHPYLDHTVSDPHPRSHEKNSYVNSDHQFQPQTPLQRWGSDFGGYGATHDRYNGQNTQGGITQLYPPLAQPVGQTGCDGPGYYVGTQLAKTRSLPLHAITRKLSERTGRTVETGNIRTNLYEIFGEKSSVTCKAVVETIFDGLTSKGGSSHRKLKHISSKSIEFLRSRIDKYRLRATKSSGAALEALNHAPKRPDRCILIAACQSDEKAKEHRLENQGAFTKLLLEILDEHPGPIDNHRLVYECRNRLAKAPYRQHPCLYSTPQQAHNVFICY